jgi:hypothetical protein
MSQLIETPEMTLRQILNNQDLQPAARANLLLRICQAAQDHRLPAFDEYFEQLRKVKKHLPEDFAGEFEALQARVGSSRPRYSFGALKEMAARLDELGPAIESGEEGVSAKLQEELAELKKRWWMWGRKPLWQSMIPTLCRLDRKAGLPWFGHLPEEDRLPLLRELNGEAPLAPEEWDLLRDKINLLDGRQALLLKLVGEKGQTLNLSLRDILTLAQVCREEAFATDGEMEDWEKEERRDDANLSYVILILMACEHKPEAAVTLFSEMLQAHGTSSLYAADWMERFSKTRQLLNRVARIPEMAEGVKAAIAKDAPSHMRDFLLTHWAAVNVGGQEEVLAAYRELMSEVKAPKRATQWFLGVLVMQGLIAEARLILAEHPGDEGLQKQFNTGVLCWNPERAREFLEEEDVRHDPLMHFLWLGTTEARARYLQEVTQDGEKPLPGRIWSSNSSGWREHIRMLSHIYQLDEDPKKQFEVYVRCSANMTFAREDVDTYLLAALAHWLEGNPDLADKVGRRLWQGVSLQRDVLLSDVLRNATFDRCRMILPIAPRVFLNNFVKTVKAKMVDDCLQWREGDSIYSLSLKSSIPFLFAYMGAKNVGDHSPAICDEVLRLALEKFEPEAGQLRAAAALYAVDKGLESVDPPARIQDRTLLAAWQRGVFSVQSGALVDMLTAKQENRALAAGA